MVRLMKWTIGTLGFAFTLWLESPQGRRMLRYVINEVVTTVRDAYERTYKSRGNNGEYSAPKEDEVSFN